MTVVRLESGASNDASGRTVASYQDALHRAVEPGAQSAFSQALASGAKSFQQVADLIFTSPEYDQDLVASDFVAVFGYSTITSTVDGVTTTVPVVFGGEPPQAFWVSQLQRGQSPQEILAGILGAPLIYNGSALVQPPN